MRLRTSDMVNRYPNTLINELNSLLAPFEHMIDGSVDDTVTNGVAADVSPFIITREGPRMLGAFGMLLHMGPRISVDIESSYNNTSKPDFSLRMSGDPKADARLIFSKTRNLLNLQKRATANPAGRRLRNNPEVVTRNGIKYPRSFIKELNTMVAPLGVMIDGSLVDDDVREGIAADVSTFIRSANGQMTMGGLDMLLYVGARPHVEIYTGSDNSKPSMKIALTGVARADAKTVFSRMRPLLVPARANPHIVRFDARKLINKLNRNINTNADIRHDPATALETIFLLGITIGKMDELGEAATARDKWDAELAINRIAGFYEHLTG